MAASRSSSTDSLTGKSKKELKRAKREMNNTSLATNKFGAILGIFVLIFAIIYAAFLGTYAYKRKTGQTQSALKHENPFANFADLGKMEALKNTIKFDENGKVVMAGDDMARFKEIFGDAFKGGEGEGEEKVEEVGNEPEEVGNTEEDEDADPNAPKAEAEAPKEEAPNNEAEAPKEEAQEAPKDEN